MSKQKDYYKTVGARITDPIALINKKAFAVQKQLEANGQDTKEFHKALATLSDPVKKETYDEESGIAKERRAIKVPTNYEGVTQAALKRSQRVGVDLGLPKDPLIIESVDKPRSGSGGSIGSSSGNTDIEDRSDVGSPVSINGNNSPPSVQTKKPVETGVYKADEIRRRKAANARKQKTANPVKKEAVKTYERDAVGTRIKFDTVSGGSKILDPEVLKAIEKERSFFTKIKISLHHKGFLTEKETRAVEELDQTGKKDAVSVQKALKVAKKGWGRG